MWARRKRSTSGRPAVICVLLLLLIAPCCSPGSGAVGGDGCYILSDFKNLPRPRTTQKRSWFRSAFDEVLSGFLAGVGDRYRTWVGGSSETVVLHEWARKMGAPVNAQAIWLTRDWNDSWLSRRDLEKMVKEGIVPVLILYYFGEDISKRHVLRHRNEWYAYLMRVASLAAMDHPVMVVIEPEFNDMTNQRGRPILSWPGFNEIVIDGIYLLRSMAPNLLVGVCPGDFGMQDLEPCIGEVVQYSDFIAFQEMRASTRPSPIDDDYEDVTERTLAYAGYLHDTFDKPILLAYLAVSTHDPDGGRWTHHQESVIRHVFAERSKLEELGVFGILYFMLFDDPEHTGYFHEAERFFGLADRHGVPKPGWHAFKHEVNQLQDVLVGPGSLP